MVTDLYRQWMLKLQSFLAAAPRPAAARRFSGRR